MKRIITLLFCLTLAFAMPVLADGEETAQIEVSLRIEGISENLGVWKDVVMPAESTVADVIYEVLEEGDYVAADGDYGVYFSAILGEEEGLGNYGGWKYCVDNQSPSVGMGAYTLQGGESIVVYYGDLDTLYPILSLDGRTLSITAASWQADESGEWAEVTNPVAGVTVLWNGEAVGVTDEAGLFTLPEAEDGKHTIQIQLDGVTVEGPNGQAAMPKIVRLSPNAHVVVAKQVFSDLPMAHPAYEAVMKLHQAGIVNGKGGKRFGVDDTLTSAELAVMLYRVAGAPAVEDSNPDVWYHDAAVWAGGVGQLVAAEPYAELTGAQFIEIAAILGHTVELPESADAQAPLTRANAAILLAGLL